MKKRSRNFVSRLFSRKNSSENCLVYEYNTARCLQNLHDKGYTPDILLDVGAYEGSFSIITHRIFPHTKILMIEANPDKKYILDQVRHQLGEDTDVEIVLLGDREIQEVPFFKMETGSSIFEEKTDYPRVEIKRNMTTLDNLLSGKNYGNNIFLKLDVQGAERMVIDGAQSIIRHVRCIFMEMSLLDYSIGAPQFAEMINYMNNLGFVLYEIPTTMRLRDKTLNQIDAIFVQKESYLRKYEKMQPM